MTERGLMFSPEKPVITNIRDGFDFLGFNIRRYSNGKFIIKPSRKNVKTLLDKVRRIIEHSKASTQQELIGKLNPIIRGWTLYHAHNASKQAFSMVNNQIWQCLWRWVRRRHPKKGRKGYTAATSIWWNNVHGCLQSRDIHRNQRVNMTTFCWRWHPIGK